MILLTLWTVFSISFQDTIPPAERDTIPPDSLPVPAVLDTIPPAAEQDTVPPLEQVDASDLIEEPEEEPWDTIHVWNYRFPDSFDVAETDSSLRWVHDVNLFERYYRNRGAITYRTGTIGRPDAMDLHGYETRHLNLEMEGMRLNDPLTGAANWNRMPTRKITDFRESDFGAAYHTQTRLKDFYLVQPRTYLNFDESRFNYRSLDFVFTQNFRQDTNVELSFWDRRDGGGYARSDVEGRQAAVRIYHQLNDRWMLRGMYLNNAMDRQEPFGYVIPGDDPRFFGFNHFVEQANQGMAESNQTSSDIYFQAHHRRDIDRDVSSEFGLHIQTDRWSLSYTADTLATSFTRAELYGRQHMSAGPAAVTATARGFYLGESDGRNLSESAWIGGAADLDASLDLTGWSRADARFSGEMWSDERITTELSGRLFVNPVPSAELALFGGMLSRAPDIQAFYWQSGEFEGNPGLRNEQTLTAGASAQLQLGRILTLGVRGDLRETEDAAFVDQEGRFVNIYEYRQVSGTGWLGLDSQNFEGELSANYKRYFSDSEAFTNRLLDTSGDRTLLKGHLYWKSYLFDQATYATIGFSGVWSPNAFRTAEFLVPLNRWQHGTNLNRFQPTAGEPGTFDFYNPSYYRVDLDVAARIRWFMLLLKWENIFDRVDQLGYFETTGYPMPDRRFMLGLRILFTN
jgi:hypothetical protein